MLTAAAVFLLQPADRPVFETGRRGGCCWCFRETQALCCIISLGWLLRGPPSPPYISSFFLRMHHLLTWQCVAVPSAAVSHLGQHPPSAFTAVRRQSNHREPVLSWPEEGCDFSARCSLLHFKSPVGTKGDNKRLKRRRRWRSRRHRQQPVSLSCSKEERRMHA